MPDDKSFASTSTTITLYSNGAVGAIAAGEPAPATPPSAGTTGATAAAAAALSSAPESEAAVAVVEGADPAPTNARPSPTTTVLRGEGVHPKCSRATCSQPAPATDRGDGIRCEPSSATVPKRQESHARSSQTDNGPLV
jgi:hypothetical protein